MTCPAVSPKGSTGFSLIELLLVLSIMVVLMGLLFEAFGMIRRQAKKVQTKSEMGQLKLALIDYMKIYPILGNTCDSFSSDFIDSPWTFLGRNPIAAGQVPYMPVSEKFLAIGPAAGPWTPATLATGDQILDAYTTGDSSNHFYWSIFNGPTTGGSYTYTDKIYLRSTTGTPLTASDDMVERFTRQDGNWTTMTYDLAEQDIPAPW